MAGNSNISRAEIVRRLQDFSVQSRLITDFIYFFAIEAENADHTAGGCIRCFLHCFAATLHQVPSWSVRARKLASCLLFGGAFLLPVGFFLGGVFFHAGDPGLGIVLVPVGAAFLIVAVLLTALATRK